MATATKAAPKAAAAPEPDYVIGDQPMFTVANPDGLPGVGVLAGADGRVTSVPATVGSKEGESAFRVPYPFTVGGEYTFTYGLAGATPTSEKLVVGSPEPEEPAPAPIES